MHSLYIVATPIGNLKDISARAIEVLGSVDCVLCEDTRVSSKLMEAIGVKAKFLVYNDHTAREVLAKVIERMKAGETFALISDAGTPLVSDPGYRIVKACQEAGLGYTTIPGASAVVAALTLSGLPSDRFLFAGFAEKAKVEELARVKSTLIFFESPNRLIDTLKFLKQLAGNREVAVVREITKIHEEVVRGSIDQVLEHFEATGVRGEIVIVLAPPAEAEEISEEVARLIDELRPKLSKAELSRVVSSCFKISKNKIYKYLLEKEGEQNAEIHNI